MFGPAISTEAVVERLRETALHAARQRAPACPEGRGVRVNAFWVLTACPAFAGGWKAGALAVEDVTDGVPAFTHRCLAFFATDAFIESAELPGDPAGTLLAGVNSFEACLPDWHRMADGRWREGHTLDGIAYKFEWQTVALRWGRFEFGNPRTAPLIGLERGFFELADRVRDVTGNPQLVPYLEYWRNYVDQRTRAALATARDHSGTS